MTTREFLLDVAASKLGDYAKGSPEVVAIWRDVLPASWSDKQVEDYARTKDWCGGFVLHCLREAKLTDAHWKDGSGFISTLIGFGAATKSPKPGDIGLRVGPKDHEVYHHFLFKGGTLPSDWESYDGNTPTAALKHHTSLDPTTVFYSIEKLLPDLPEGGFVRGQEFSVPGIQDK